MLYTYENQILVVEPTEDFKTSSSYTTKTDADDKIFYRNPCAGYKVFSFYIPNRIKRRLNLEDVKFLAVHESGDKAVFLEAFTNGTEKR